jgi:hypothetical protein
MVVRFLVRFHRSEDVETRDHLFEGCLSRVHFFRVLVTSLAKKIALFEMKIALFEIVLKMETDITSAYVMTKSITSTIPFGAAPQ